MENELIPTLKLSLEMTNVLAKIEYNGLKINLDTRTHTRRVRNRDVRTRTSAG